MLKFAMRLALTVLFLLSLLTWIYVPILITWEMSVVTTELGGFLAVLNFICLLTLKPWTVFQPPYRPLDVFFHALAIVAIGTYLAPIFTALEKHPAAVHVRPIFSLTNSPIDSKVGFHRYTFLAANDVTPLNLDFYPPSVAPTTPSAQAPWILVIHGGGWINGDSEQVPELNWHLANRGYGIVSIDYRLSPGWMWPAPKDDAMKALEFIRSHAAAWNLDPARWAILGRSAGAQIAGVVAYSLHGRARPSGFISYYGPSDLVFGYAIGQEDDILRSRTLLRGFLGGTPEESKTRYESASVMRSVTKDACPTLLIHGEKDTIVWLRHSERLYQVLTENKIDAQFLTLDFGPHGFDFFFNGPEAQIATDTVDHFLDRVLPAKPN